VDEKEIRVVKKGARRRDVRELRKGSGERVSFGVHERRRDRGTSD